jgi:hypothetical protein
VAIGEDGRRAVRLAAWIALGIAIAMRVHNAIHYIPLWGFDALHNWRYIQHLTSTWTLPAPDAGWSAAHPPLFYYASALLMRLLPFDLQTEMIALRLAIAAAGLAIALLTARCVEAVEPGRPRRALLALGLVLFLPVHVYMSAMVTEEMLAALFITLVLAGASADLAAGRLLSERRAVALGLAAGAAFLTKLTGVLVIVATAAAYLLDRWNRRASLSYSPLRPVRSMVAIALVVGGWFYLRNWIGWGYLYPHGLAVHEIMFSMPPGEREWLDYLRFPLSTWTDPQVLNPKLLRSVWGTTYLTWWFDGHRSFLPSELPLVDHFGTAILALALVPSAAAAVGVARGARRALGGAQGPDALLTGMVLLGLVLPFAFYASEVLDDWMRRGAALRLTLWGALLALAALVIFTFSWNELLWNMHHMEKPGLVW